MPISSNRSRASLGALLLSVLATGCGGGGDATSSSSSTSSSGADIAELPDPIAEDIDSVDARATALARGRRPPAPPPPPAPAPPPPPSTSATSATCGLPDFQASVLARINQYRAAGASCRSAGSFAPAAPLAWNSLLAQAAAGHSQDMAANNYFSHTGRNGSSMVDRVNATGYAWSNLAENIAAGYPSVTAVVDGWMASDGHCRNLMNPQLQHVGLACVASSTSTYRTYWTMDAARPR